MPTGCTAISLLRKAIEKYDPQKVIVAAVFHSEQGIKDIKAEMRNCKIYICGHSDDLNKVGLLEPGVGDIDRRTQTG